MARFSRIPKSFRSRKAVAKSQPLWLQGCSIYILGSLSNHNDDAGDDAK